METVKRKCRKAPRSGSFANLLGVRRDAGMISSVGRENLSETLGYSLSACRNRDLTVLCECCPLCGACRACSEPADSVVSTCSHFHMDLHSLFPSLQLSHETQRFNTALPRTPQIIPVLSRINPTSHIDTYFFKIHLNIVLPSPVFFHIVSIVT